MIHQVKTRKITTVKEDTRFWRFHFSVYSLVFVSLEKMYQTLETVFHRLSKQLELSSKILRYASYFQLSSRCLDILMRHCLSCLYLKIIFAISRIYRLKRFYNICSTSLSNLSILFVGRSYLSRVKRAGCKDNFPYFCYRWRSWCRHPRWFSRREHHNKFTRVFCPATCNTC